MNIRKMPSFRIRLRLLLLLCLAIGLLLAWFGIKSDLWKMEAEIDGTNGGWQRVGDSGGIVIASNGDPFSADIYSQQDLQSLLANYDTSTIEYLGIYSAEAYQEFEPDQFPNVKKLHLRTTVLGSEELAKTARLVRLESLVLSEAPEGYLVLQWQGLARIAQLKYLLINFSSAVSFADFPELKSLRHLTLNSPPATKQQISALRTRLPNCTVTNR